VLAQDPNFWPAHFKLSQLYATTGRFADAVRELRKVPNQPGIPIFEDAEGYEKLNLAVGLTDRTAAAAIAFAAGGNRAKALDYLEQAYVDGNDELILALRYPALDSLRSEPRYKDLMRRMGLPE
jgi:tetratricopeptide (TPR) repeat protein